MTTLESQKAVKIRGRVLKYFEPPQAPANLTAVLSNVQEQLRRASEDVSEADIKDVILRLIGSGKLMYTSDMRISLGK